MNRSINFNIEDFYNESETRIKETLLDITKLARKGLKNKIEEYSRLRVPRSFSKEQEKIWDNQLERLQFLLEDKVINPEPSGREKEAFREILNNLKINASS